MNIQNLESRIIYAPTKAEGYNSFDGVPIPDQEILDIIGEEGVHFIDNRLKKYIDMRKELHGDEELQYYGMHYYQRFFDLKERIAIKVMSEINRYENGDDYVIEVDKEVDISFFEKDHTPSDAEVAKLIRNGGWAINKHP